MFIWGIINKGFFYARPINISILECKSFRKKQRVYQ